MLPTLAHTTRTYPTQHIVHTLTLILHTSSHSAYTRAYTIHTNTSHRVQW